MINRDKLEHILEYAKQQRHIGQSCKVPPEDMVEIMERLLNAGNSPVIPDTWIPVSERMPEDEQEVLTINRMGHRFVSFFDKHSGLFFDSLDAPAACCIEHVLVTHWMELPAAPQEVKGE
ncbi:DUF551 domain-containing protein [Klebsiella pneumoniae]